MGFIVIESNNPKFSYVINKNPATSPHIRSLRKGFCLGWFHDESNESNESNNANMNNIDNIDNTTDTDIISNKSKYIVRFIDTEENVSFPRNKEDLYDYLPYMQYCSPLLVTCVVREMFNTTLNQGSQDDAVCYCSIEQAIMKLNKRSINLINKLNIFVKDYKVTITPTNTNKLYKFVITSNNSTINDLFKYAYMLGYIINCITFGYIEIPAASALDKVIKIINDLNLSYYVRYTIKMYMLGRKDFTRIKSALEGNDNNVHKITMMYGNTQCQRFETIKKYTTEFLSYSKTHSKSPHIVDIGCGEGYYVRNLLGYIKMQKIDVVYHAHDIDDTEMDKIDILIKSNKIYSVVKPYRSFNDMINTLASLNNDSTVMIIFSEVIEHIPCDQVKLFMIDLINRINFNMMLVTTPQVEFNKHYLIAEGEFRHVDHKQEFTKSEFEAFMNDVVFSSKRNMNIESEYIMIGDVVDNVSVSQGMILRTFDK